MKIKGYQIYAWDDDAYFEDVWEVYLNINDADAAIQNYKNDKDYQHLQFSIRDVYIYDNEIYNLNQNEEV